MATGGRGGGAVKLEVVVVGVVVMAAAAAHACEIGSLFLARKPSTSYTTSPAKWRTANAVGSVFMSLKCACLLCTFLTFSAYEPSLPFGKMHSSVSAPINESARPAINSTTAMLSVYLIVSTSTPSSR